MTSIPDDGKPVAGDRNTEDILHLVPEWQNLGLLIAFGWLRVQSGSPDPGGGWKIERVWRTDVGDAMLAVLHNGLFSDKVRLFELNHTEETFTGILQAILQPYLPDWQQTIQLPTADFVAGMYTFRVSLGSVWRRIAIAGERTLDDLALAILRAFDFDSDHLYVFTYRDAFGREIDVYHSYMDEPPFTSEMRVGDVPLHVGQMMTFLFDFGASWKFKLVLDAIDTDRQTGVTQVIEAQGDPPEQYPNW